MNKFLMSMCILIHTTCFATYWSQCGQDKLVHEHFFTGVSDGVFVDIGAHNGVTYSNTYFFESELNWNGICIEPNPSVFVYLQKYRHSILLNVCISDHVGEDQFLLINGPFEMWSGLVNSYDPRHLQDILNGIAVLGGSYEVINVQCYRFNDVMEKNGITHINFLSIDTEGGEFEIISSIDFSKFEIDVITIENNFMEPRFVSFFSEKGFDYVTSLNQDMIFVNKNFKPKLQ